MKLKDILLIISSSVILTSCNYLDVVPSEIPQLSDAFKKRGNGTKLYNGECLRVYSNRELDRRKSCSSFHR